MCPSTLTGFPGGSVVKNPPANTGNLGSIPGFAKIPWRRKWQPTPVPYLENPHGLRGPWHTTIHGVTKHWTGLSD